jgi:nicotinate-nucleotide pyrophosphorylase (carboxylating)
MQNFETKLSEEILDSIRTALKEDIGSGDVTTNSIVPLEARMKGQIIAKQSGILAGLDVAQAAYHLFDAEVVVDTQVEEGARVEKGQILAFVSGRARSLLTVERTALNFLGRMSGIATFTRQFVDAVSGSQTVILDTRKTAPGLRAVDKLAVLRRRQSPHRFVRHDLNQGQPHRLRWWAGGSRQPRPGSGKRSPGGGRGAHA